VRDLQIDFELEGAYPYGHLILEEDAIRAILASIPSLQHLTVFIVEQPKVSFEQMNASSQLAPNVSLQCTFKLTQHVANSSL
jgi:hypothetical protein